MSYSKNQVKQILAVVAPMRAENVDYRLIVERLNTQGIKPLISPSWTVNNLTQFLMKYGRTTPAKRTKRTTTTTPKPTPNPIKLVLGLPGLTDTQRLKMISAYVSAQ
jgi:hypothetical protein